MPSLSLHLSLVLGLYVGLLKISQVKEGPPGKLVDERVASDQLRSQLNSRVQSEKCLCSSNS